MDYGQQWLDDMSLDQLLDEALLWLRMLERDPPEGWNGLVAGLRVDMDVLCARLADPTVEFSKKEEDARPSLRDFCAFLRRHHEGYSAAAIERATRS